MTNTKRIAWLDYARAFAIICVILVHTIETLYSITAEELPLLNIPTQFCVLTIFTIGRLGVPFFLMITGYLLLDREYDYATTMRFYKQSVLPLFLVSTIWYIIYDLFLHFCFGHEISLLKVLLNVFYVLPISISHAWYLPTIIGLYICVPLLASILRNIDLKMLVIPILLVLAFLFARNDLNVLLFLKMGSQLGREIDFPFMGGVYGLYLIMGYMIRKDLFQQIKTLWMALLSPVSLLFVILLQWYSFSKGVRYTVWYDSILLFLSALSLFLLCSRAKLTGNAVILVLSRYSFAIYLIHNMIVMLLPKYLNLPAGIISFVIIFVLALVIPVGIAFLIDRISAKRILSKYLLYLK